MPRRRSTDPIRMSTRTRWLSGVGVAVIAVAVVVLVVLALTRGGGDAGTGSPRPVPTFTSPEQATPSPTPTLTVAPAGAVERLLAIGTGAMWRATAGECGVSAPLLERSTDDGKTWQDVTPTYRGVAQILSLDPLAGDQAEIVARVGAACEVQALRTFTYGRFWEPYPDVLAASTYIDPTDAASVVTPRGEVAAPCSAAWGLRSAGGTVALLCDGTAYELSDGRWDAVATDAVAVTIDDGTVVAVTSAQAAAPAAAAMSGDRTVIWSGSTIATLP